VVPPPEGWTGPAGASAKGALRLAEREIALTHEGIHGKEVFFLYASARSPEEVRKRLPQWRALRAAAILSFADEETNRLLLRECGRSGPPLILAEGENLSLRGADDRPLPFAFALGLYWTFRANAIAEAAVPVRTRPSVAIFYDPNDPRLFRGAARTDLLVRRRGGVAISIGMPGVEGNDPSVPVGEAVEEGAGSLVSWLDAQGTLTLYGVLSTRKDPVRLYHGFGRSALLLGASGVLLADQRAPLENDEKGKQAIQDQVWRLFGVKPPDPVLAGMAYAMGRWVIAGLQDAGGAEPSLLAPALARVGEFPLLGEVLAADPATHRPLARRVGLLVVRDRRFVQERTLRVLSRACEEGAPRVP
jgi:hypothetical protein